MERHVFVRYVLCLRGWRKEFWGVPRWAERICRAENMCAKQEPKTGSKKRSQRTGHGAQTRGWLEGGSGPGDCCHCNALHYALVALSCGALKRSKLTGSTLLPAPCRTPRISDPGVQKALLAQTGLANLCCSSQSPCWCVASLERPAGASHLHRL